jgi:peptide/nickel transport system permease protein
MTMRWLLWPTSWACLAVLLALACAAAPASIAPADPYAQHLLLRLRPPVWLPRGVAGHVLGTDQLGRDVLSRMVFGARLTIVVTGAAMLVSVGAGGLAGLAAGYYGRGVDAAIVRLIDIQLAFPVILLVIAVVTAIGPSLANLIVVMGLSGWPQVARVVRGTVRGVRQREFVEAARAVGAGDGRIIFRHVLPNVADTLIVYASFEFARLVLVEATLGYLGLGVQPPAPTWGGMIGDGEQYLAITWAASLFPGIAIAVLVLSLNTIGESLRRSLQSG